MKNSIAHIITLLYFTAACLCHSTFMSAQIILSRDEAIEKQILQTDKVKAELLRYRNAQLAYENMHKELLPAISLAFSPLNFNHSMRLLQNPTNGDYYNVNDYTNTSAGGITVSQKIKATGGSFSLISSLSILRDFSNSNTGVSSVPLYLSYNQPLFGGGKTLRLEHEIQKQKVELTARQLCVIITEAQREVSGLYMQALAQRANINIAQKATNIGDTLVALADTRKKQGRITSSDYAQVKIQQLENIINLKKAQHELNETLQKLKFILKCDSIIINTPDYNTLPESLSENEIMNKVCENNPSFLSQQIEKGQAEKDIHEVKNQTRFNADISVSYGLNQYSTNIAKAYRHPDQAQGISITFRIPVFQWGINRNKRIMVENEHEAIKKELEQEITDLHTSTHRIVFQYNYSREMVDISKERCEIAQDIYEQAATKFKLAKISAIELTQANQDMFSAVSDYAGCIQNLYECYFSIRSMTLYDFTNHIQLKNSLIQNL